MMRRGSVLIAPIHDDFPLHATNMKGAYIWLQKIPQAHTT